MNKNILKQNVEKVKSETHDALQLIIDELNSGQRKKLLKNEDIKNLLERYEVLI